MNTEFGEKLQTAMDNSLENLVWIDRNGEKVKMMEANSGDLKKFYNHAHEMLYNTDPKNPGKYKVRENIKKLWDDCNVELFVRHLLHECDTPIKTKRDILDFISQKRDEAGKDISHESISMLFNGLDPIYEKITIGKLMDECFDKLDVLNRRMITDKFILSQGVWLTDDEKVELTERDENGVMRNRLDVMKERLSLDPNIMLRISPTGLSFAEFRSLVQLSAVPKISTLPTIALQTLRDKILLLLDNDLNYHIDKWTGIINDLLRVAEARNIQIVEPTLNE